MPEIPDLNIYRDNLQRILKGKKISDVEVTIEKKVDEKEASIKKALKGKALTKIIRDGKMLHFQFTGKVEFAFHLMLHGKLHLTDEKNILPGEIIRLNFENEKFLILADRFRWARAYLHPPREKAPDVMSKDFTWEYFNAKMDNSKVEIKDFLRDQKIMRGLGNAYTDEILWEAKISPFSLAGNIPVPARKKLFKAIPAVLKKSEKYICTHYPDIINDIVREHLVIHNNKKKSSPRGELILSTKIGMSKTYYTKSQKKY